MRQVWGSPASMRLATVSGDNDLHVPGQSGTPSGSFGVGDQPFLCRTFALSARSRLEQKHG